jgi:hypothetical protein
MEDPDTKSEDLVSENQLPAVLSTENNNYNGLLHLAVKRSSVGSENSAGEPPSKKIVKEMTAVDVRDQVQAGGVSNIIYYRVFFFFQMENVPSRFFVVD